ncbi:MAG: F0F1 ATP synthase subunit B [Actinomycetaceae bacterium]|nr:F0F1 ATP synthase subunit B [Actinomycetaceae bacterium]MDY6082766.1 F0F1 ATP synthase subunit B [Actinomycetaceae bacterium]
MMPMLWQPSVLLPSAPDLIYGTLCFIVIAIAMYKFAWPSFMHALDTRREKIEDGLRAAEHAQDEVAAARGQLESDIQSAHRDAAEIREKAQNAAKGIVADAQSQARKEADRIVNDAQVQIDGQARAATRTLHAHLGVLASELAERIVGEQLQDPAVASRVIDRFLDDLQADQDSDAGRTREASEQRA